MAARSDPRTALLKALTHEVGNLLAAVRLSAHLLPHAAGARERARGARQIEQLVAQAGEILAQVRPLLAEGGGAASAIAPGAVLEGVHRALSDVPGAERLVVEAIPRGLPDVYADPDALLHALLALARGALEATAEGGKVTLRARRSGREVSFDLADDGRPLQAPPPDALPRGRALALRLADAALRREGGHVEATRGARGTRIRVCVRSAARRRARPGQAPRRASPSARP